jgi:hypothetical protein
MPTDVLKVSGDYNIQTAPGGTITLDLATSGTVIVNGSLQVRGTQTLTSSTIVTIKDNIIVLNSGETASPPGVTLGTAGILIARGNNDDPALAASIIYSELPGTGYWTNDGGGAQLGVFEFKSNNVGSAVKVNAIRIDTNTTSTLNILGAEGGNYGMINVIGQIDYDTRVLHDDDIPNKKYVDNALYAGTNIAKKLLVGGTTLVAQDSTYRPIDSEFYNIQHRLFGALGTSTNVVFDLYGSSAQIQGFIFDNGNISNAAAVDIVIQPQPGNAVTIKETLKIGQITTATLSTLTPELNTDSLYYTGTAGGGGTGLYYVNTNQSDELVSRRKAIIYGIIF